MVVSLGREAIWTALLVAGPMLGAGLLVGIVVSVLQVATSIQDITLTFIPKIIAVFLVLLASLTFLAKVLIGFASHMISLCGQVPG
jgi:flagellar biosynthetic protein FliQ